MPIWSGIGFGATGNEWVKARPTTGDRQPIDRFGGRVSVFRLVMR